MELGGRFLESTRGQVLTALRKGSKTVEELAKLLGLTDNAIRSHLSALERDGLIRQEGLRRMPSAGKPAVVYEILPEAEVRFSRAYAPILQALIEELPDRLSDESVDAIMRGAGKRLAATLGTAPNASMQSRADAVVKLLADLGGIAEANVEGNIAEIHACGSCPLAAATRNHPALCVALESLLEEFTGASVKETCIRGDSPRCSFQLQLQ
jgi:predicted ArsR family transcriptional regulator